MGESSAILVDIFDLIALERIRRISHLLYGDDLQSCDRLRFTPDGKQLLTIPGIGPDGGRGGPLQLIDMSDFTTIHTRYLPDSLTGITGVAIARTLQTD